MAIINLTPNFTTLVFALTRIADALDRAIPPINLATPTTKRGPDAIIRYGENSKQWAKEHFQEAIREMGASPTEENQILREVLAEYQSQELPE